MLCVVVCCGVFFLFCSFARVSVVVYLLCGALVVVCWLFCVGV